MTKSKIRRRSRRSKSRKIKKSKIRKSRSRRRSKRVYKTNKTSDCRLNIILDIDETLGHNIKRSLWDRGVPEEDKKKYNTMDFSSNVFVIRPYIKKFLKFLFDNFNVSIWTLGSRDYAIWVAHNILIDNNKNRHVKNVMWSTHDSFSSQISDNAYGKDLKYLWIDREYDDNIDPNNEEYYYNDYEGYAEHPFMMYNYYPCNTILIDDSPNNATNERNHFNAIHINPFSLFGHKKNEPYRPQYNDRTLLDIIKVLEKVKKQIDKNSCSDKYFATCMDPDKGRNGRVFDSDLFKEYYQSHNGEPLHVHVGPLN